jgi:hypothetical protein
MSGSRLRDAVARDRARIRAGDRPLYHVTWAPAAGGAIDVQVAELPISHLFAPDPASVPSAARALIAQVLGVDSHAFEVQVAAT